jgi:hypothetical protein
MPGAAHNVFINLSNLTLIRPIKVKVKFALEE